MSKNQRKKQRIKRKEKRQLKHQLIVQAKCNKNDTPIGKFTELNKSFMDYAISNKEVRFNEKKNEFTDETISQDRRVLIDKAIKFKNNLNPNRRSV